MNSAAEESPSSVVVQGAVAVTDAADLLDEEGHGFGRSVRRTASLVVEELARAPIDHSCEAGQFGHVSVGGVLEEHDQLTFRCGEVGGGVDLGDEFAGEPHRGDLTIGVTGGEPGAEAFSARSLRLAPSRKPRHIMLSTPGPVADHPCIRRRAARTIRSTVPGAC